MYINGSEVTSFSATTDPSQNVETSMNTTNVHTIGYRTYAQGNAGGALDAYLADFYFIDGSALDASSFGAYDSNGVWQAAAYSGTFGTNGVHLKFENDSTQALLGTDSSGNDNTFLVYNLTHTGTVYQNNGSITVNNGRTDSAGSFANVFNGTVNANADNAYGFLNGAMDFTWNLDTAISFSSQLRVWTGFSGGTVYLNDDTTGVSSVNNGYTTLATSAGTLSKIRFTVGSSGGWWAGVLLDGNLLTSGNPADFDCTFDAPTNGTQSDTGAGGEVSGCYCTLNAVDNNGGTLSNGNLQITTTGASNVSGTIGMPSGKFYWEVTINRENGGVIGIGAGSAMDGTALTDLSKIYGYSPNGQKYENGTGSSYGATYTAGDVIGVKFDATSRQLEFLKNNSSQGVAFTVDSGFLYFPQMHLNNTDVTVNWGQRPFAYTAARNYKALCTTNIPTPTIADGSEYFQTALWSGTGSARSITTTGMSPDWVWIKERGVTGGHNLYDAVRGATKFLASEDNNAEGTDSSALTSFNSDGFSLGTGFTVKSSNKSGRTYAGWCWDAGSSTVSNTDGTGATSVQVRANQTAGFSIITFTSPSTSTASYSVGHGLNAAPEFWIWKSRGDTGSWQVYFTALGSSSNRLNLNSTGAVSSSYPGSATSSVINLSDGPTAAFPGTNVIYAFAPVAGFSSFGTYEGNGSTNGVFVHTGMRPAWILVRSTSSNRGWVIWDTSRDPYNVADANLFPNNNGAESSSSDHNIDILSNGFKLRTTSSNRNGSGETYVYAAFSENAFSLNGGLAR